MITKNGNLYYLLGMQKDIYKFAFQFTLSADSLSNKTWKTNRNRCQLRAIL